MSDEIVAEVSAPEEVSVEAEESQAEEVEASEESSSEGSSEGIEVQAETEEELQEEIEQAIEDGATKEEVMNMLQESGISAGAVRTIGEAIENCPQLSHRNYWHTLNYSEMGDVLHAGSSYILSKTPYAIKRPAPNFGEHTEYVCTELLGMSPEEFDRLKEKGLFS